MTYGWAILIIAIVLLAFFALGVFNPYTFTPKASAGNCQILRPNSPGTSASEIGPCNNEIPQSVARLNGNGYILVPAYPVANLPAYTINIWVYTTTSSYDSFLLYGYANTAAMPGCPSYTVNANPIGMATWNQNYPGNWYSATSNVSIPGSSWNMITLALSNGGTGTGTVSVYLNGVSSNTIAAQEVVGGATPSPEFEIGGATTGCLGSPIGTFTGSIANIQIYNTSLSQPEITALYKEGIGGVPFDLQNLAGWWPLNGNSKDYSGNGNAGVPTNVIFTSNWESGYSAP